MPSKFWSLASLLAFWVFALEAAAVEPHSAHTYRLSEGESPPVATVEDVAWLAGSWNVSGFGKTIEEYWSKPSAGTMIGSFKLMDGDRVEFYELMELGVTDGRLGLKVKHFSADFTAWEDRPDYVHFKLVALEPDAAHFSGISFYRRGPDTIEAFLLMREGEQVREEKLSYTRQK